MPRPLFLLFGKRKGRRRLLISSHVGGKLIFLHNAVSGRRFLVDTGAARSVLPHRFSATADGPRLVGADGRPIPTWKTISINLQFVVQKFTFHFFPRRCPTLYLWNRFSLEIQTVSGQFQLQRHR